LKEGAEGNILGLYREGLTRAKVESFPVQTARFAPWISSKTVWGKGKNMVEGVGKKVRGLDRDWCCGFALCWVA